MGLNCVIDWEKEKRIDDDLRDGRYIFVGKSIPTVRYVGTVSDFLSEKKEKEPLVSEDDLNWNSVILEREVRKAILKVQKLKTKTKKTDVVKQNQVEKLAVLELPAIALHGRNSTLNQLMSWSILGRLIDARTSHR
jgi:hypothetical protein